MNRTTPGGDRCNMNEPITPDNSKHIRKLLIDSDYGERPVELSPDFWANTPKGTMTWDMIKNDGVRSRFCNNNYDRS